MNDLFTRRQFFGIAGATAVGLGLAGCSSQVGTSNTDSSSTEATVENVVNLTAAEEEEAWKKEEAYGQTIIAGYNGGACLSQFGIAKVKGYYDEEGLDVNIVSMTSASDGLGTGQINVAGDHIATLLVPAYNGVQMTFTTGAASGCKSLYVLASSDYKSTADLADKKIGLTDGIGASDQNIAMRFFRADDVDINSIKWTATTTDAVVQALQSGELDGAMLSDQFAFTFVKNGTLRYVRSLTYDSDFSQEACCICAFNTEFLEKNPVTCKKFTRAFHKADFWIQDNMEEAVDIMFENSWASGDKEVCLEMVKSFNWDMTQKQTEQTLLKSIKDYKEFGILKSDESDEAILNKVWAPLISD